MVNTYLYLFRELQTSDGKWLCCEPVDEKGFPKPYKFTTVHEDFPLLTGAGHSLMEDCIGDHICYIGAEKESEPVKKYLNDHVKRYMCNDNDMGSHVYYDRGAFEWKQIEEYIDKMDRLFELTGYIPESLMADTEDEAMDLQRRFTSGCINQTQENKLIFYGKLMKNNPVKRMLKELYSSQIGGEALEYYNANDEDKTFSINASEYTQFGFLRASRLFHNARIVFWYQDL